MRENRYSNFINKPHLASRLAFLVEGIRIIAAADAQSPGFADDPEIQAAAAQSIRQEMTGEMCAALQVDVLPPAIGRLVAKAAEAQRRYEALSVYVWQASQPPPMKPPKAPEELKPARAIVGLICGTHRSASSARSERAFHDEIAGFLNAGIPASERGAGIEGQHVRRADKDYWHFGAEHVRSISKQLRVRDARHPWERGFAEIWLCNRGTFGDCADDVTLTQLELVMIEPISALLYLERQAKSDQRFKRLKGAELAQRIDEISPSGLAGCVHRRVCAVLDERRAA